MLTRLPVFYSILCYECGAPIDGTTSAGALCYECIKLTVDVSAGIQREATLTQCRNCERWLQPPSQWLRAAPESRELLALCLRRLRGLSKLRVVDAGFLWTEPHSKRLKVKITVQQEAFPGSGGGGGSVSSPDGVAAGAPCILQQAFEVEYVVAHAQCADCAKAYTPNTWRAVVQVRQRGAAHKRTLLHLEQLILRHGAHRDATNIRAARDGLDVFFAQRNHAERFVDFVARVAPARARKSSELVSADVHTSTANFKFAFSVELVPACRDDLVALPLSMARALGNIAPLLLCHRVGPAVGLLDPDTLQTADVPVGVYWREPFSVVAAAPQLVEFVVLQIEPVGGGGPGGMTAAAGRAPAAKGGGRGAGAAGGNAGGAGGAGGARRFVLAEATVARAADMAAGGETFFVRTHLGGVLRTGDSALGYLLRGRNVNNRHYEALEQSSVYAPRLPDVVLVRKHYARRHAKKKSAAARRNWRLKRLGTEDAADLDDEGGSSVAGDGDRTGTAAAAAGGRKGGARAGGGRGPAAAAAAGGRRSNRQNNDERERAEADYEMFLRDLEEDAELRSTVALFKAAPASRSAAKKRRAGDRMEGVEVSGGRGNGEEQEEEDGGEGGEGAAGEDEEEEEEEGDDDLPAISMDELLDDFDDLHVDDRMTTGDEHSQRQ